MNIKEQQGTTLVQRASANVKGFNTLHKRLEKKIIVSGKRMSTLGKLPAVYRPCRSEVQLPSHRTRPRTR